MSHLKARAVALHPARYDADLIERQQTPDGVPVAVKEHDVERRAFVLANNAKRCASRPFWRGIVTDRLDDERRYGPSVGLEDGRRQPAVKVAAREMPEKIDDPGRAERLCENLGQQFLASGAEAFQAAQRREKSALAASLGRSVRRGVCLW